MKLTSRTSGPMRSFGVGDETNAGLFGCFLYMLSEFAEALNRRKAVGLQNKLGLKILDTVEGSAVGVGFRRQLG